MTRTAEDWPGGVVITGGAGGIGEAVALRVLEGGGRVAVADSSSEALAAWRDRNGEFGGRATTVHLDVTNGVEVRKVFGELWSRLGGFQTLVNCAGGGRSTTVLQISEAEWDEMLDVNLKGTFLCCQAFTRRLTSASVGGAIVNVSSTAAQVARPGTVHYGAAKAGVNQLTKVLAIELAEHGIRVNAVCPGVVGSPRVLAMNADEPEEFRAKLAHVPQGRLGEPAEIADTVMFLASPSASFVTGAVWNADGGYSCGIPRY